MDTVRGSRAILIFAQFGVFFSSFSSFSLLSLLFVSKFAIGNGSVSMRFHRVCDIKNASICNVAMHTEHSLHTVFHSFYYIQFGMANVAVILLSWVYICLIWCHQIEWNRLMLDTRVALFYFFGSYPVVLALLLPFFFIVCSRSNMEERFLLACHTTHIQGNSYCSWICVPLLLLFKSLFHSLLQKKTITTNNRIVTQSIIECS